MVVKKLKELLDLEFPHGDGSFTGHHVGIPCSGMHPLGHQIIFSVDDDVSASFGITGPWWDNNISLWLVLLH